MHDADHELVSPACGTRTCDCWRELACMIPTLLKFGARRARGKKQEPRRGCRVEGRVVRKKDVDFVRSWGDTFVLAQIRWRRVLLSPVQSSPVHPTHCASRHYGGSRMGGLWCKPSLSDLIPDMSQRLAWKSTRRPGYKCAARHWSTARNGLGDLRVQMCGISVTHRLPQPARTIACPR